MPYTPPPPIISIPAPAAPQRSVDMVEFEPGRVACAGQDIAGGRLVRPFASVVTRYGPVQAAATPAEYRLAFAIDATGRPRTIRRDANGGDPGSYVDTSDLAPALAGSRFAPGAAQADCGITYRAVVTPVASAPLSKLYQLVSQPPSGTAPAEVFDRVRPADSDCRRGPGTYVQLNQPAFATIPQPPGTWSWTFLTFDVTEAGKPANVRVAASGGNGALDRAGMKALSANLYAPDSGRRGCFYYFYRSGAPLEPAPALPADTPSGSGQPAACRIDAKAIANLSGGSAYPRAFARRRIEGAAAISYDTAPWGAVGNLKVIASEPADAFGEAARNGLVGAKVAETETGHRGCIFRIRFVLPSDSESPGPNAGR